MALSTTVLASIVVVLLLAILAALPEESRPAAARCPVWFFNQVGQAATVCRDVASEVSSAAGFAVCSCSARRFGRCLMSFMTAVAGFAALNAGLAQIGQGGLVPHDARDEGSPRDFGSRFSTSKFEGGGGAQRAVPGNNRAVTLLVQTLSSSLPPLHLIVLKIQWLRFLSLPH
jgi:hypothetical protein